MKQKVHMQFTYEARVTMTSFIGELRELSEPTVWASQVLQGVQQRVCLWGKVLVQREQNFILELKGQKRLPGQLV